MVRNKSLVFLCFSFSRKQTFSCKAMYLENAVWNSAIWWKDRLNKRIMWRDFCLADENNTMSTNWINSVSRAGSMRSIKRRLFYSLKLVQRLCVIFRRRHRPVGSRLRQFQLRAISRQSCTLTRSFSRNFWQWDLNFHFLSQDRGGFRGILYIFNCYSFATRKGVTIQLVLFYTRIKAPPWQTCVFLKL